MAVGAQTKIVKVVLPAGLKIVDGSFLTWSLAVNVTSLESEPEV